MNQCWFNVGPLSTTLDQHQANIDSAPCVCWVGYESATHPSRVRARERELRWIKRFVCESGRDSIYCWRLSYRRCTCPERMPHRGAGSMSRPGSRADSSNSWCGAERIPGRCHRRCPSFTSALARRGSPSARRKRPARSLTFLWSRQSLPWDPDPRLSIRSTLVHDHAATAGSCQVDKQYHVMYVTGWGKSKWSKIVFFHPLEVVGRGSETRLQLGENSNSSTTFWSNVEDFVMSRRCIHVMRMFCVYWKLNAKLQSFPTPFLMGNTHLCDIDWCSISRYFKCLVSN